jgi:hypothetical protein
MPFVINGLSLDDSPLVLVTFEGSLCPARFVADQFAMALGGNGQLGLTMLVQSVLWFGSVEPTYE